MAIEQIPLRAVPAQTVQVTLAGQPVTLYLRQLGGRQCLSASWAGQSAVFYDGEVCLGGGIIEQRFSHPV